MGDVNEVDAVSDYVSALAVLLRVYLGSDVSRGDLDDAIDTMFQLMEHCNDEVPKT